jgi:hypothetical protein
MLLGQVELEDSEAVDYFDVRHVERMVPPPLERGFIWQQHRVPAVESGAIDATWHALEFYGTLRVLREKCNTLYGKMQCPCNPFTGKMQYDAIKSNRLQSFTGFYGKNIFVKGPVDF